MTDTGMIESAVRATDALYRIKDEGNPWLSAFGWTMYIQIDETTDLIMTSYRHAELFRLTVREHAVYLMHPGSPAMEAVAYIHPATSADGYVDALRDAVTDEIARIIP